MSRFKFHREALAYADRAWPGAHVISTNRHQRTVTGFFPVPGQPNTFKGETRSVPKDDIHDQAGVLYVRHLSILINEDGLTPAQITWHTRMARTWHKVMENARG